MFRIASVGYRSSSFSICIMLMLWVLNMMSNWKGVEGQNVVSNSFTFYYNEKVFRSGNSINCNSTMNVCSSPLQFLEYLATVSEKEPNFIADIRIILLSNMFNVMVPTRKVNKRSIVISSSDESETRLLYTNSEVLFQNLNNSFLLETFRLENIQSSNPFIFPKASTTFLQSCIFEKLSFYFPNRTFFNNSKIVKGMMTFEDVEMKNTTIIESKITSKYDWACSGCNFEETVLSLRDGGKFEDSNIVSSSFKSESGDVSLISSNVNSSRFDFRRGSKCSYFASSFSNSSILNIGMTYSNLEYSNFTMNTTISVLGTQQLVIQACNFIENWNALSLDYVSQTAIAESNFIRNTKPLKIINPATDYSLIHLYKSLFKENIGDNGGVINSINTNIASTNNYFISNRASNGGVCYFKGSQFFDNGSKFISNQAILGLFDCSNSMECGNGGIIFSDSVATFNASRIEGNRAVKGAICFNNCEFQNALQLVNNKASYLGDAIFFGNLPNQNLNLGNSLNGYGSRMLRRVEFSIVGYRGLFNSNEFNIISLYPGESIILKFSLIDYFNNTLTNAQMPPTITPNSDTSLKILTTNFYSNNTLLSLYIQSSRKSGLVNGTIQFPDRDFSFTFGIQVGMCPFDYAFDMSSGVCVFRAHTAIILASVFGFIILLALLLVGLVACIKIVHTLIKFYRRERKEKNLAYKILDKKFVFGDESPLLVNLLSNNASNIIIPIEDIEIVKRIGEGATGLVYLGHWNAINVALKSIKTEADFSNDEFEHEASLLNGLRHPCIVRFYGISLSNTNKYMVVEYLEKGSLESVISQCKYGKIKLDFKGKIEILKGIASGMDYLHSLKPKALIHRDLKPGNILLDSNMNPKVCDFGLSKLTSSSGNSTMTMNLGTMLYMAPEIVGSGYEIGSAIDVYSFSMIMYELLFMEKPFNSVFVRKHNSNSNTLSDSQQASFSIPLRVAKGERPDIPWNDLIEMESWINENLKPLESERNIYSIACSKFIDLMKQCWDQNPQQRPTFKQLTLDLHELLQTFQ